MRFAIETWAPEYGVATDESTLQPSSGDVDVAVECAADAWAPRAPTGATAAETITFVDGIRRIDARIWVRGAHGTHPGVCASVAAGAVRCTPTDATVVAASVRRGVFAAPDGAGPIVTSYGSYELYPCADSLPESLYLGVHEQMTELENDVSDTQSDAELLVFDGPLRGRTHVNSVGYVKTQHVQYLPDALQAVLGDLDDGERTPVFLIRAGGFTRWSWYLRLPGRRAHALSGVVRCELPGIGTAADAVARADEVSATLPRFASRPHKEPRAPQNLYPIAGLESQLRRRLGDQQFLERTLRRAAA